MLGTKADIWSHLVGRQPTGRESAIFFALYLLFQENLKVVIDFYSIWYKATQSQHIVKFYWGFYSSIFNKYFLFIIMREMHH